MKKAKIMLVAITVFAAVGGLLAFKAKTFNGKVYCTTDTQDQACNIKVNSDIKPYAGGTALFTAYYTTTSGTTCPSNLACESTTSISFQAE